MSLLLIQAGADERAIKNFSRELSSNLVVYDPRCKDELPYTSRYDGVVISGSASSVLDNKNWMENVQDIITMFHGETPILGVCWGHQMIAHTMGGEVSSREYREIGYKKIFTHEQGDILEGFENPQIVFETHEDQVTELPENAILLAYNSTGIQSFKVGKSTYGVQFHPEYQENDMEHVINKYMKGNEKEKKLSKLTESMYSKFQISRNVLYNFEQKTV